MVLQASASALTHPQAAKSGNPGGLASVDPAAPSAVPVTSLSERLRDGIQEAMAVPEADLLGSGGTGEIPQVSPGLRATLQATEVENLRVLPSGPLPPNPAELLASQTFRRFFEWLKGQADVVVFDSPPVLSVTDAAVLSTLADGTLLVVNCGETRLPAAAQAIERLASVGGHVLGVVLNRMSRSAGGYYHHYYYYDYYRSDGDDGRGTRKRRRGIARLFRPRRSKRRSHRQSDHQASSADGSTQSEG